MWQKAYSSKWIINEAGPPIRNPSFSLLSLARSIMRTESKCIIQNFGMVHDLVLQFCNGHLTGLNCLCMNYIMIDLFVMSFGWICKMNDLFFMYSVQYWQYQAGQKKYVCCIDKVDSTLHLRYRRFVAVEYHICLYWLEASIRVK